jgi:hypothetical protein
VEATRPVDVVMLTPTEPTEPDHPAPTPSSLYSSTSSLRSSAANVSYSSATSSQVKIGRWLRYSPSTPALAQTYVRNWCPDTLPANVYSSTSRAGSSNIYSNASKPTFAGLVSNQSKQPAPVSTPPSTPSPVPVEYVAYHCAVLSFPTSWSTLDLRNQRDSPMSERLRERTSIPVMQHEPSSGYDLLKSGRERKPPLLTVLQSELEYKYTSQVSEKDYEIDRLRSLNAELTMRQLGIGVAGTSGTVPSPLPLSTTIASRTSSPMLSDR